MRGSDRAVKEYLADVKRAGDSTYGAVRNSIGGLEDLTTSLLTTGKGNIKQWVDGVIAEITRIAVVKPLLNSIFAQASGGGGGGGLGIFGDALGFISGFLGGGLSIDAGGIGTNLTGGGLPTSGGRAAGGPVDAGRSYLVGENGPEVLRMGRQGGTVIPNGQLAQQGDGAARTTLNINQTFVLPPGGYDKRTQAQIGADAMAGAQRALARNG